MRVETAVPLVFDDFIVVRERVSNFLVRVPRNMRRKVEEIFERVAVIKSNCCDCGSFGFASTRGGFQGKLWPHTNKHYAPLLSHCIHVSIDKGISQLHSERIQIQLHTHRGLTYFLRFFIYPSRVQRPLNRDGFGKWSGSKKFQVTQQRTFLFPIVGAPCDAYTQNACIVNYRS